MKYYLIAGESSGDLHAANLMVELKAKDPSAQFRFWGGDRMKEVGGQLVRHISELAFMGFWEVLKNLPTIFRNLHFCKQDISDWQPDVVILVDYPGFNFRLLKFLKEHGFKIIYYISPQIWAWRQSRVYTIKKYVDRMLVIFPFEEDFYARFGVKVDFVGHPLLDELRNQNITATKPQKMIALLPGSRKQEIEKMLPVFAEVASRFPEYKIEVAALSLYPESFYRTLLNNQNIELRFGNTYDVLSRASAAMVTSGTATLETALLGVPQVVCYKGNWFSYIIGRMLVKVSFIAIVNLIVNRKIVEELIQDDFTTTRLENEVRKLLSEAGIQQMKKDYTEVKACLGLGGASARTAEIILQAIK